MAAETLDGKARLAQLHGIFHMDEQVPFRFEWDWLAPVSYTHLDVYKRQKLDQKVYYNHSDYVGGMRETTL